MFPAADQTAQRRSTRAKWWALAVLMLPVLLIAVDNTVLAFALPAISKALTPTGPQLLWIVDVYPLVLAGLLVHLEMPDAEISVAVTEHSPRSHGRDAVAIRLAPHPGAQHRPVAQAASGGELSRVMLALEVALSASRDDRSAAPVFVFDEIDAGIGGRAALAVGQRLARLARHAQVIVVTHLPQVAAHAGTHLQIVKSSHDGATSFTVEVLEREERIRELARMLSGDDASDVALAHAEQLLDDARSATSAPSAQAASS